MALLELLTPSSVRLVRSRNNGWLAGKLRVCLAGKQNGDMDRLLSGKKNLWRVLLAVGFLESRTSNNPDQSPQAIFRIAVQSLRGIVLGLASFMDLFPRQVRLFHGAPRNRY